MMFMRKIFNWIYYLTALTAIPFIVSCGGDSNDAEIVDGVRVNNGRKLKEFTINDIKYELSYDSQNRLKTIVRLFDEFKYDDTIIKTGDTIIIDYDRYIFFYKPAIVKFGNREYSYGSLLNKNLYSFVSNEKGLIAKIDIYTFIYDEASSLVNVKGEDNFSIMYINNELTSLIQEYMNLEAIYDISDYKDYGDADFNYGVSTSAKKNNEFGPECGFILAALQSGLFGNPPGIFRTLSQRDKSTVHIDISNSKKGWNCEFIYE